MEIQDKDVAPAEEEDPEHSHDVRTRSLELDNSVYCLTFVCLIEKVRTHKKAGCKPAESDEGGALSPPDLISEDDLGDYFYKCTMIYCIQIILVSFILHSAYMGEDSLRFI